MAALQKQRAVWKTLFWICAAGWCVRLVVVALVYQSFLAPGRDHWEFGYEIGHIARSIATGHGFADPYWTHSGPTALLTPVYPCLLAAIFVAFGVSSKLSALVYLACNTLLSSLTAIPIYSIARRSFDRRVATMAAWTWAFFPNAINFSAATMWYHGTVALELSLLFLLVLVLGSAASHGRTQQPVAWWALLGLLAGLTALTNPVILGIVPFLAIWLAVQRQRRPILAHGAIALAAMLLTILPWSVRNMRTLHQPVLLKDGLWTEVCIGNCSNSLHWWDGTQHPSGSDYERRQFEQLGEPGYMAAKRTQALAYLREHPRQYLGRSVRRVVFLWTGFWSVNPEYLREEPLDPPNIFFLTALSSLALAGLYLAFRTTEAKPGSKQSLVLYVLVLAVFPVPYYLTHLDPGYRHPLDPLLVILACSAVARWLPTRSSIGSSRGTEQDQSPSRT